MQYGNLFIYKCASQVYIVNVLGNASFEPATEADKQVIKTPVVRNGKQSTLGYQPDVWKKWE